MFNSARLVLLSSMTATTEGERDVAVSFDAHGGARHALIIIFLLFLATFSGYILRQRMYLLSFANVSPLLFNSLYNRKDTVLVGIWSAYANRDCCGRIHKIFY